MLFKSALLTSASGSLGGVTASHNRGGLYLRARVIPVDPATPSQLQAREAMTNTAGDWALLSEDDRMSWMSYAQRILMTGPLGDSVQLSGQQMYVRSKIAAARLNEFAGFVRLTVPDSAPAGSTLPAFVTSPVLVSAEAQFGFISVSFDTAEPWVTEDAAAMLLFVGAPQGSGINFFKGPFRLATFAGGSSTSPPSSPFVFVSVFPIAVGQKVWLRIRLFRGDGSLSSVLIEGPVVVIA